GCIGDALAALVIHPGYKYLSAVYKGNLLAIRTDCKFGSVGNIGILYHLISCIVHYLDLQFSGLLSRGLDIDISFPSKGQCIVVSYTEMAYRKIGKRSNLFFATIRK